MSMILNIILFVGLYPVLFILYFVMKNTAKVQNGILFGAAMKKDWLSEEAIEQIIAEFYKEMKKVLLIFAVIPVICFLTPYVSIQFTIWMVWMLAMIVGVNVPLAHANKKIKDLKMERGWYEDTKAEEYTEIKAAGQIRRVKFAQFAAPIFLSIFAGIFVYLIPGVLGYRIADIDRVLPFRSIIVVFALTTLLFYGVAVWMDKRKTEVVSNDSDVNVNYTRAKKNIWKNFWLVSAWINTLFTLILAAALFTDTAFGSVTLWGAIIYTVVICMLFFPLMRKLSQVERAYWKKMNVDFKTEDDRCWIWGTFYYNPKDRHSMVNKRVGVGTTINMATTTGKVFTVISVVSLAIIPISCVWMIMLEFTPISLKMSENNVVAEHLKVDYEIPVAAIDSVELIYEKPEWSKVSGVAMDNLDSGTFYEFNVGKCEAFMNPQNAVFLRIQAEGVTYYMSGADDEETMQVYEEIGIEE